MAKFPLDENQLYEFMQDLNINIGEHSDTISTNFEHKIREYAERYCPSIDEKIICFVTLCVQDSYFLALKTFEESLKKTLLPDFDSSDETE